jgi:3-deoxy-D-manno-octulosonic acid kinase
VKTLAHKHDSHLIVYDADVIEHPGSCLFSPDYWSEQGAVTGTATGRGSVLFLDSPFGPAVLRQYLRGGWAAKASRDRYVFSGFEQSRPVAEFAVLEQLSTAGLPAAAPLAAMCAREGPFYRGWILMRMISGVMPLADLISKRRLDEDFWLQVGACIRRFHDFGVVHADLNARNILVSKTNDVYLVDFDRARLRARDHRAFSINLRRLHRSLQKVWPEPGREHLHACWMKLLEGYDSQTVSA